MLELGALERAQVVPIFELVAEERVPFASIELFDRVRDERIGRFGYARRRGVHAIRHPTRASAWRAVTYDARLDSH
jgi:hypothetical protein